MLAPLVPGKWRRNRAGGNASWIGSQSGPLHSKAMYLLDLPVP